MTRFISYFSLDVIKYHDPKYLKEEMVDFLL